MIVLMVSPMELQSTDRRASTALLTDRYEFTQVEGALLSGVADHRAVFEVFARSLPNGNRYGIVAGTSRVIDAIENFRFDQEDLEWLLSREIVSPRLADWLAHYRFSGSASGYPEGEVYFPNSPVFTVESTFAEAILLETVILSILNDDSAVATTAARIVKAARGRKLIEMGSRRTNEQKAIVAARAAYIAGFDTTSNLMAGRRYDIPTAGTSAHAFTLAHPDEQAAFACQVAVLGVGTTLLVDTYDVAQGVENAIAVAGSSLGGIRIDSEPLREYAIAERTHLDSLGATGTKIIVTGDLDEYLIDALTKPGNEAPIDGFGVGTRLVSGAGCPPPGFVYKLVSIADKPGQAEPLRPVAKRSTGKATVGGRKLAFRQYDGIAGPALAEYLLISGAMSAPDIRNTRPLWVSYIVDGFPTQPREKMTVVAARDRCRVALTRLPENAFDLSPGDPAIPTTYLPSATVAG
jgi:nicotinate phosphoribosyltransferase